MDHVGNTVGWTSSANGGKIPYIDITKTWMLRLTCNQGSPVGQDTIIYILINHDPAAPVTNSDSSKALDTNVPNIFSFTTTVSTNSWESHEFEIPSGILNENDNTIVINNTWGWSRVSNLFLYTKEQPVRYLDTITLSPTRSDVSSYKSHVGNTDGSTRLKMTSDVEKVNSIKFINPNDNTSNDIIKYNDPVSISTTDGTRIAYYYDDGNAHTDRPLIFDTVDNIANISSKSVFYIKSELNSDKTAPIYEAGGNVNYTDSIGIAASTDYNHTSNGWYGARNMVVSGSSNTNIEMDFIHGDDTYDGHSNTGFPETFNMSLTS